MRLLSTELRGLTRFIEPVRLDVTDHPPGIIALVGGNGEGKTTLIESIPAALFREFPSRPGPLKDYAVARDAVIDVHLEHAGHDWRLLLQVDPDANGGRGKEEAFLFRDGQPLNSGKVREYDELIAQFFPAPSVYFAAAFASQTRAGNFFDLSPADRKRLFVSLLGLGELQQLSERARFHARSVGGIIEAMDGDLARLDRLRLERAALEGELADARGQVEQLAAELARAEGEEAAARQPVERARAELRDLQQRHQAHQARAAQLAARIEHLQGALARSESRMQELETLLGQAHEIRERAGQARRLEDEVLRRTRARSESDRLAMEAGHEARAAAQDVARLEQLIAARQHGHQDAQEAAAALPGVEQAAQALAMERARLSEAQGITRELAARVDALRSAYQQRATTTRDRTAALQRAEEDATRRAALLERVPCGGQTLVKLYPPGPPPPGGFIPNNRIDCGACELLQDARQAAARLPQIRAERAALDEDALSLAGDFAQVQEMSAQLDARRRDDGEIAAWVSEHAGDGAGLASLRQRAGRLVEVEQEIQRLQGQLQDARRRAEEATSKATAAQQGATTAREAEAAASAALAPFAGIVDRVGALDRAEAAAPALRDQRAAARAELEERQRDVEALGPAPSLAGATQALETAEGAWRPVRAHLDATRARLQGAESQAARAQGALDARAADIAALDGVAEQRATAAGIQAGWALLERSLGPNHLQALEIDAAGPEVSAIVNDLLEATYGPRFSVELVTLQEASGGRVQKEIFDLRVFDALRGTPRPLAAFSGGEKVVIDEAVKLGLAVFNARRSGQQFGSIFRDECDGALSEENALLYPAMLRRARELGGIHHLFFVSHRTPVWEQADAVIRVEGGRAALEIP